MLWSNPLGFGNDHDSLLDKGNLLELQGKSLAEVIDF